MGKHAIDLTGQRFGRLVAIRRVKSHDWQKTRHALWLCKCDCGEETEVHSNDLRSGGTRSCGCLRNDIVRALRRGQKGGTK